MIIESNGYEYVHGQEWHIPTIHRAHLVGLNTGMDPIIGNSEQEVDKTRNFHGITENSDK